MLSNLMELFRFFISGILKSLYFSKRPLLRCIRFENHFKIGKIITISSRHLSFVLLILFFLTNTNLNAQSIQEMLLERKIEMAINDAANDLMVETCPTSGRFPWSKVVSYEKAAPCNEGNISEESCYFLVVQFGFHGWTCYWETSKADFFVKAIVLYKDGQILEIPREYIEYNDAFRLANACDEILAGTIDKGIEGMLEKALEHYFPPSSKH